MTRPSLRLVVVVILLACAQVSISALYLDNLAAYWALGEASGSANDSHASNHLTETSGTIDSAAGKLGNARDFEAGDTEYFAIADNAALSMGDIDFTITAWVNLESKPANEMDIVSKFETVGNLREYRIEWTNATDRFLFVVSNNGTATATATASTFGAPSLSTWCFIVAKHDSVNNIIGISVNDGAFNTTAHTTGVFDSTSPFHIGALGRATPTFYFDGLIDDVGIWKRVLTAGEITALYNSGNGFAYSFGEGGGASTRRHRLLMGM